VSGRAAGIEAALDWLSASPAGRVVGGALARSHLLHLALGGLAGTRASAALVPWFARSYGLDLDEAAVPEGGWESFNDFFARPLRPGARPVDPDPAALVSPADGHAAARAPLRPGDLLPVKGTSATVAALLGDADEARAYEGGAALVVRLYLEDPHRTAFPCDGTPGRPRALPGVHHAVTPRPGNDAPWLARNVREVTALESPRFGRVALVDVGGFLVSSIRQLARPGTPAARGAERAAFLFGGSTVVVLVPPGRARMRDDLLAAGKAGSEVRVRQGEAVGWASGPSP